jgi:hypothetical protein
MTRVVRPSAAERTAAAQNAAGTGPQVADAARRAATLYRNTKFAYQNTPASAGKNRALARLPKRRPDRRTRNRRGAGDDDVEVQASDSQPHRTAAGVGQRSNDNGGGGSGEGGHSQHGSSHGDGAHSSDLPAMPSVKPGPGTRVPPPAQRPLAAALGALREAGSEEKPIDGASIGTIWRDAVVDLCRLAASGSAESIGLRTVELVGELRALLRKHGAAPAVGVAGLRQGLIDATVGAGTGGAAGSQADAARRLNLLAVPLLLLAERPAPDYKGGQSEAMLATTRAGMVARASPAKRAPRRRFCSS